ncbi:protein translocase subunit SecD [Nakamurella leprariae]|uniref:Protein translocase subunit SecD n=1 Tax=Nakamurella leprariae TaxID=2803911 RepID=A0A938YCF0_9ACTN|nr:protein translocase subunit SecD [Nakamurella leprariae]MBM9467031.1 protein translocase subunit SecD [Nakamurella leprariae]
MASPARQFRPWRSILAFLIITAGLYGLVFLTPGANTPKLGIDLQGGTRITLTARTLDGSDPSRPSMQQARTIMETRVNGSGVAGAQVQIEGSRQLVVTVPGTEDLTNLTRSAQLNIRPVVVNPSTSQPASAIAADAGLGDEPEPTESSATSSSTFTPTSIPAIGDTSAPSTPASSTPAPSPSETVQPAETPAETSAEAPVGFAHPAAAAAYAAQPTDPATTDAPATTEAPAATGPATTPSAEPSTEPSAGPTWPEGSNPDNPTQPAGTDEAAFSAWEASAQTVLSTIGCADLAPYAGLDDPAKPLLACDETGDLIYVLRPTLITGTQVENATAGLSSQSGQWVVNMTFRPDGYSTWASFTASNIGTLTAITLDGQVLSAPRINQAITTQGTEISGTFNQETATALANSLKFGALPLAFDRAESVTVSAQLGSEYLRAGLIAGGIGLLLVIVYCLIYYRLLGVITILSLILSFGLVYAIMVLLGRWIGLSLDMAGVAGLIIAIGITADSFVIYFERLKDEVRDGRTFRSAVPRGWSRAKRTILSADAVSFLSAAVLYVLAVGEVKGFAFTLGLTTVLDLVVVFLVTHPLVALAADAKVFASPTLSGLGGVAAAGRRQRAAVARVAATAGVPKGVS